MITQISSKNDSNFGGNAQYLLHIDSNWVRSDSKFVKIDPNVCDIAENMSKMFNENLNKSIHN